MCLTAFQSECERQLMPMLEELGWLVVERRIEGVNEKYIRIQVQQPAVSLFVYEDEAGIQGRDIDIRLEHPDYQNPDKLIAGLLRSIRELNAT